ERGGLSDSVVDAPADGERLFVVLERLLKLAELVIRGTDRVERPRLSLDVASLSRERQRALVCGECFVILADHPLEVADIVENYGVQARIGEFARHGERLLVVAEGTPEVAEVLARVAEIVEAAVTEARDVDRLRQLQSALEHVDRILRACGAAVDDAERIRRERFLCGIARSPAELDRFAKRCLRVRQ